MKKKLIIYGLGQMFQSYYDEKTKRHLSEKYELVGLIDKNSDLLSNIDLEINLYSFIISLVKTFLYSGNLLFIQSINCPTTSPSIAATR